SGIGSDAPVPRRSNRISRLNDARRRRNLAEDGSSQMPSTLLNHPFTKTRSIAPSPTTWYAMRCPSPVVVKSVSGASIVSLRLFVRDANVDRFRRHAVHRQEDLTTWVAFE